MEVFASTDSNFRQFLSSINTINYNFAKKNIILLIV